MWGVAIAQSRLDELWDFEDPDGSEKRFAAAAAAATSGAERAELQTQVARALGLQGRGAEADAMLAAIDDPAPVVGVRCALERGRLHSSAGNTDAAVPMLREAARLAAAAGLVFLQVDALHMLVLADAEHAEVWTAEALAALDGVDDTRTLRWRVALHNNIGWTHFDAGRFDDALSAFQRTKHAAVHWGTPAQVQMADEAIVETRATIDPFGS